MIAIVIERERIRMTWPKEYYFLVENPRYIQIICKDRANRFEFSEAFCKPAWKAVKK